MYQSSGVLKYGPGLRAIVLIDQGISDFYRSLIPKYYNVKPQKHRAHITVVRNNKETPTKLEFWEKYQGQKISFFYCNDIQTDGTYFWLNVQSEEIGNIREELGLSRFRDDRQFGGFLRNEYHITIANVKI
jgi:hypothetical protein